jgi:hypothetical protein
LLKLPGLAVDAKRYGPSGLHAALAGSADQEEFATAARGELVRSSD